jgi:hypothetical protein
MFSLLTHVLLLANSSFADTPLLAEMVYSLVGFSVVFKDGTSHANG